MLFLREGLPDVFCDWWCCCYVVICSFFYYFATYKVKMAFCALWWWSPQLLNKDVTPFRPTLCVSWLIYLLEIRIYLWCIIYYDIIPGCKNCHKKSARLSGQTEPAVLFHLYSSGHNVNESNIFLFTLLIQSIHEIKGRRQRLPFSAVNTGRNAVPLSVSVSCFYFPNIYFKQILNLRWAWPKVDSFFFLLFLHLMLTQSLCTGTHGWGWNVRIICEFCFLHFLNLSYIIWICVSFGINIIIYLYMVRPHKNTHMFIPNIQSCKPSVVCHQTGISDIEGIF